MSDFEQIESSQRQRHEEIEHEARMYAEQLKIDYTLFSILRPKFGKDGNQWFVLHGENIQEGICGFGDTLHDAIVDFNSDFKKRTVGKAVK